MQGMTRALGVDIGTTNVKVALVSVVSSTGPDDDVMPPTASRSTTMSLTRWRSFVKSEWARPSFALFGPAPGAAIAAPV